MKDRTRRAIAYIVGRLVSASTISSVYEYASSKHFNFGGDISPTNISIYDYDQRYHISGSRGSGSYSLFHYGNALTGNRIDEATIVISEGIFLNSSTSSNRRG